MQGAGAPNILSAITMGFAGELQIPKGIIFINGTISKMLAAGIKSVNVIVSGGISMGVGATPNIHSHMPKFETVGPAIFYDYPFLLRVCLREGDIKY